ncbi:shikimate dehydrogenase [Azonexus sp.]|uniref:shikimate dehydrogenase n=1 Tax=Azonexus sp. TaxID=1872668 RepID=UPI0039E6C81C
MAALYCVFGNPIAHSKSPAIHRAFAAATGQDMRYHAQLAPREDFAGAVRDFIAAGGCGANVTVPFKEEAFRLCTTLSAAARLAGAVNTLSFMPDGRIHGDNTDGAGLLADLQNNLHQPLAGRRIALLGAGGAARGVLSPLLDAQPAGLWIANRSADKARALAGLFTSGAPVRGGSFAELAGGSFDLVINATAASLAGEPLPLPEGLFAPGALAYDMMYGNNETPFLTQARTLGAARCADGLGMLVEQAAAAFDLWRGQRPDTADVLRNLRASLNAPA